jgi:ubiquinone/menaquinone biosynthesis C-methylase UbiE
MRQNLRVRYSAELYDHYTAEYVSPWDQIMIVRAKEELKKGLPDGVILDVGVGTAQLLCKLAAEPEFIDKPFLATDLFEDMLELAQVTVDKFGQTGRVIVEKADVHELPYPDDHAALVISRSTIHHWAKPDVAFKEIFRVLKKGGVAIIHDMRRDANPEALQLFHEERARGGIPPTILEEKYTVAEVQDFVKKADLESYIKIHVAEKGPNSLGYEVRIQKPYDFQG